MIDLFMIFLGGIAAMAIGVAWYSPFLFGRLWMSASGFDAEMMKKEKAKGMGIIYGAAFLNALVMSSVVHYFVQLLAESTWDAVFLAVLFWLGFVVTTQLASVLWEKKPFALFLIHIGQYLVTLVTMALISNLLQTIY
jgi:hypothetical protein